MIRKILVHCVHVCREFLLIDTLWPILKESGHSAHTNFKKCYYIKRVKCVFRRYRSSIWSNWEMLIDRCNSILKHLAIQNLLSCFIYYCWVVLYIIIIKINAVGFSKLLVIAMQNRPDSTPNTVNVRITLRPPTLNKIHIAGCRGVVFMRHAMNSFLRSFEIFL